MSGFCTEVGVLVGLGVKASIEMWINVDRSISLLPFLQELGSHREQLLSV